MKYGTARNLAYGLGGLVIAGVAIGGTLLASSHGPAAQSVRQVQCFARVTSSEGYAGFTIQVLGTPDCFNIADQVNSSSMVTVAGDKATANTGSATGTEICSGTIGNYPVNVYGAAGDTGVCTDMGLPVVP